MTYDRSVKLFDEPHAPVELEKQVQHGKINRGKFLSKAHAGSYLVQMQTIHELNIKRCFEVGPGEAFVARNMKALGYTYDTLDFEAAHNPTIVADFAKFDVTPLKSKYDISCAFQVLEHFPFEVFPNLINKLMTVSEKYVFISLPYSCQGVSVHTTTHFGQHNETDEETSRFYPTNLPKRVYRDAYAEEFPWAVHFWEIGRQGFPLERIMKTLVSCGLSVRQSFHAPNPFHYFILCEKN